MIQDSDEDILDSDFLKWATSIKQSFRYQLEESIRKRITDIQTAVDKPVTLFPFTTSLYVQYRTSISKLFIPLAVPIEVFVLSDGTEATEYCINSAFDILLNKMRNGFDVIGSSQNTHDYRYFFPMNSESAESSDQNTNTDQFMTLTYTTKNMKSNLFKDTYKNLQRASLL